MKQAEIITMFKDKNLKERMDILLRSQRIIAGNPYYNIVMVLRLLPIARKNIVVYSFGDAATGKSHFYENILQISAENGFPTEAELRGSKIKGNNGLLNKDILILEEIADISSTADGAVSLLKSTITSQKFTDGEDKECSYNGSLILNFNLYRKITDIDKLNYQDFGTLPQKLQDKAFLTRVTLWLYYSKEIFGENLVYLDESNAILEEDFYTYLLKLRDYKISLPQQVQEKLKNGFDSRKRENISNIIEGLIILLYPDYAENPQCIPDFVLSGFVEVAKHFSSLVSDKYKAIINEDSYEFLLEIMGENRSHITSFLTLHSQSNFAIERGNEIQIYAINELGREKNREVVNEYKDSSELFLKNIENEENFMWLLFEKEKRHRQVTSSILNEQKYEKEKENYLARLDEECKNIDQEIKEIYSAWRNVPCFLPNLDIDGAISRLTEKGYKRILEFMRCNLTINIAPTSSLLSINNRLTNPFTELKRFYSENPIPKFIPQGVLGNEILEIGKEKLKKKNINIQKINYYIDMDTLNLYLIFLDKK